MVRNNIKTNKLPPKVKPRHLDPLFDPTKINEIEDS
jgi:hypothetical protein